MRILRINHEPFHLLTFDQARPGGGVEPVALPFLHAEVDRLPVGFDAIIAMADLQGREPHSDSVPAPRLLGELVADEIASLSRQGELPPTESTLIVLAGDFFSRPGLDRRGGSGDVRAVWRAFTSRHPAVVGVAGNHDVFGPGWSLPHFRSFQREPGIHLLDGDTLQLEEGFRIAGLSGIIGPPRKPFRRTEDEFLAGVSNLLAVKPDLLVLHDGPQGQDEHSGGWPSVRDLIATGPPLPVIRGHAHWTKPVCEYDNEAQCLNCDGRVVVLKSR